MPRTSCPAMPPEDDRRRDPPKTARPSSFATWRPTEEAADRVADCTALSKADGLAA